MSDRIRCNGYKLTQIDIKEIPFIHKKIFPLVRVVKHWNRLHRGVSNLGDIKIQLDLALGSLL